MSFTVTITGVADKDVGPLIARLNLPRGSHYDLQHTPDVAGLLKGPEKKQRCSADTKIMMTGKVPQGGSKLHDALEVFEMMEAKGGIGNISLNDLMTHLKRKNRDPKMGRRLLRDGYLAYIT